MKVLFDTNVVLDVLLGREPSAGVGAQLFALADTGRIDGAVSAAAVTTVEYVSAKHVSRARAARLVRDLLGVFTVVPVDRSVLEAALRLGFADFEDAVVHEAARSWGAAGIVTRNLKDFRGATIPVFAPDELLAAVVTLVD